MKVLVVIPAYNEELNLKSVVKDIKTNTNYDYIIVNDCSKDKTLELCKKNLITYHFQLIMDWQVLCKWDLNMH